MSSRRTPAMLALAAVAVGWGAIPLIVREDVPWTSLVASRVWLGAVTMILIMVATNRLHLPTSHRWNIVTAGALLAVHWATFFWAVKLTTVAVALAVVFLGTVGAAVLARRYLGEIVTPRVYTALGIVFLGVVVVVVRQSGDSVPVDGSMWGGVAVAVVSATTVGLVMLVSKAAVDAVGPLIVTTGELVTAALVLSPWLPGAVKETIDHPVPLLSLGVVITGLGFLIYWTSMRELTVAMVSVLMHIEPASAVVLAVIFLNETPDPLQWVGIGMVIGGNLLAARDGAGEKVVGAPANL